MKRTGVVLIVFGIGSVMDADTMRCCIGGTCEDIALVPLAEGAPETVRAEVVGVRPGQIETGLDIFVVKLGDHLVFLDPVAFFEAEVHQPAGAL